MSVQGRTVSPSTPGFRGWFRAWLLVLVVLASCSAQRRSNTSVDVPARAQVYSTAASSNGVRGSGSANDAQRLLEQRLNERGDEAEPDGALADAAAWALQSAYAQQDVSDTKAVTRAAQRFGFPGLVLGFLAGPLDREQTRQSLAELVNQVPKNTRVNRYGIVSGQGSDVAIVLGNMEVTLDEIPRAVSPGSRLHLAGEVSDRYQRASIFSTRPDGRVEEIRMTSRELEAHLDFPSAGEYRLEVMGYGATGPVVLMNVPVRVGMPETDSAEPLPGVYDPTLTSDAAEAALLSLLNEERKRRGMGMVEPDPELRTLALAHSNDMARGGFFGHVSPTTGTPDDRIRSAGVRVSKAGECVALEFTPVGAHRGLLDSPAHRSAMLDPLCTHVGVGVAFVPDKVGQRRLNVTLLLGRRPPATDARLSAAAVIETIQAQRRAQKLAPLRVDAVLTAVASAGSRALARGAAKTPEQALAATQVEMQSQVNRTRVGRATCQAFFEIIDRYQLSIVPLLQRPELAAFGIGVAELGGDDAPRLGVVIAAEAGPEQRLRCE